MIENKAERAQTLLDDEFFQEVIDVLKSGCLTLDVASDNSI